MAFKPVAQLDFSGGANPVVNPYLISQKQAADIENMLLDEHGSLRTRDGSTLLTTSPNISNPILYRGNLIRNNGQSFPFAIQGGDTGSAITYDTTAGSTFNSSSGTFAMTLGASATLLLVQVSVDGSATVNSITYDGVPLTKISSTLDSYTRLDVWGLVNPTVSVSKNVIVTLGGSAAFAAQGSSFINAFSWGTATVTSTVSGGVISLTVSSDTNHLVYAGYDQNGTFADATPNHTSIFEANYSTDNRTEAQYQAGASSVTMSYTTSASSGACQLVTIDLTAGGNKLYKTDVTPWTSVGSLNKENLPYSVSMADKVVLFHGYATPKTWDGTTLASVTGGTGTAPAGAKHGVFHLGALWIWNTAASTSANDGPSSLEASATNDPNDWPASNQIFISKDDGQVGMGLSPFTIVETGIAPTATLVAFKNYSAYQITGVFGSSTFGIQPIKSDMGCVAPRTIQFVSGFGIIRLTHKGFALYNGVEDRLISEEMRPFIFGGHDIVGLDFSNVVNSWGTQSQNPPLYVAACPVNGSALTRVFIYDLIRRGWTICTFPNNISCLNLFFTATEFPVVHAGTTDGKIVSLFNRAADDDGASISWSLKTRAFFSGNQMTPSYWRRAQISLAVKPSSTITVTPILDGQTREALTFPSSVATDSPTAHTVDTTLSVDIMETAHTCQLLIEGANHCHIRGIEFHTMPKPSTKFIKR